MKWDVPVRALPPPIRVTLRRTGCISFFVEVEEGICNLVERYPGGWRVKLEHDTLTALLPPELTPGEEELLQIRMGLTTNKQKTAFRDSEWGPWSADNPLVRSLGDKGMIKIDKYIYITDKAQIWWAARRRDEQLG